jgi:hypothetical protein
MESRNGRIIDRKATKEEIIEYLGLNGDISNDLFMEYKKFEEKYNGKDFDFWLNEDLDTYVKDNYVILEMGEYISVVMYKADTDTNYLKLMNNYIKKIHYAKNEKDLVNIVNEIYNNENLEDYDVVDLFENNVIDKINTLYNVDLGEILNNNFKNNNNLYDYDFSCYPYVLYYLVGNKRIEKYNKF